MLFNFNQDPADHVPRQRPISKLFEAWGITNTSPHDATPELEGRIFDLFEHFNFPVWPSQTPLRFIRALKTRKIKELKEYATKANLPGGCDYEFELVLLGCKDRTGKPVVTRKFRCSGDMVLRTWVDKVLIPIMGFKSGYNAWVLADQRDGAVFKANMNPYKLKHMWNHGTEAINDMDFTIAHVLRKKGDSFMWCYDLREQYRHLITVTKIHPPSSSNGHVSLLSGTGAPPAEDHGGSSGWQKFIDLYQRGNASPMDFEIIRISSNYISSRKGDLSVPPLMFRFNPFEFDEGHTRFDLGNALERNVAHTVWYCHCAGHPRASEAELKRMAVCGGCGKPNTGGDLKRCTKCLVTHYCGVECQKIRWSEHKRVCKEFRELKAMQEMQSPSGHVH